MFIHTPGDKVPVDQPVLDVDLLESRAELGGRHLPGRRGTQTGPDQLLRRGTLEVKGQASIGTADEGAERCAMCCGRHVAQEVERVGW